MLQLLLYIYIYVDDLLARLTYLPAYTKQTPVVAEEAESAG
jgi:hypothetical protein